MRQLDPKAVWLFFISYVLRALILIIFLIIYGTILIWVIALAFLVLCFVWTKLTYRFYRYELTDMGFRKKFGVIYKKYVTIPYDRIQNVDIYRGIIARILGLSDLNIQTAGGGGRGYGIFGASAERRLPSLSRETAEQLREELIQRTRQSKNQRV
jgi:putative membrane protein